MKINRIKFVPVLLFLGSFGFTFLLAISYKHRYDEKKQVEKIDTGFRIVPQHPSMGGKSVISVGVENCGCVRNITLPRRINPWLKSTCSDLSTLRGDKQKVFATSLFGGTGSTYAKGFYENVRLLPKYFPGWIYRVYSDWDFSNPSVKEKVCPLLCSNDFLDWCDVTKSPTMGNMASYSEGTVWRFAALGDPTVEVYAIRDVDSYPSPREQSAVEEWEMSGSAYHIMRDHPYHENRVLAGMWGGRKHTLDQEHKNLLWDYIKQHRSENDQRILANVLYEKMQYSLYAHDSYFCTKFPSTHPWPVQRLSPKDFIGNPVFRPVFDIEPQQKCPMECRPTFHKDWEYC